MAIEPVGQCRCTGDEEPGPNGTFYCRYHECRKSQHRLQMCRTKPHYLAAWNKGTGPGQGLPPLPQPKPEAFGPGTELKKLFRSWGITGCRYCGATVGTMNKQGVEWCREHIDELVAEIHTNAAKRGWTALLSKAATLVGIEGPVVRWAITEACNRAEIGASNGNQS